VREVAAATALHFEDRGAVVHVVAKNFTRSPSEFRYVSRRPDVA
jgi:hypothetical protein